MDLKAFKQKTVDFSRTWIRKLKYLIELIRHSGKNGLVLWFKSHKQLEQLDQAIDDLLEAAQQEDFKLMQVETTLLSFVLPDEDVGQAEWYRDASRYLDEFEALLCKGQFDKKKCFAAVNELKYISQADDFHRRYRLQPIQHEVVEMYQNLQQALTDFRQLERDKIETARQSDQVKIAESKAQQAEAETKKALVMNANIKEKKLAIIEEKKRLIAEKEAIELQAAKEQENAEILAKKAEHERQAKLQDSYLELQVDERIGQWQLSDVVNILQKKLEGSNVDEELIFKLNQLSQSENLSGD